MQQKKEEEEEKEEKEQEQEEEQHVERGALSNGCLHFTHRNWNVARRLLAA